MGTTFRSAVFSAVVVTVGLILLGSMHYQYRYQSMLEFRAAILSSDETQPLASTEMEAISKFQKQQVEKYCDSINGSRRYIHSFYKGYLITYKEKKTAICYIPKTACSHLVIMFLTTVGLLSQTDLQKDYTSWIELTKAIEKTKFGAVKSEVQKKEILDNYFKFVIYRHPLDRLLSAYKDKIGSKYWLRVVRDVNQYLYPNKSFYTATKEEMNITFSGFVDYLIGKPYKITADPHFLPFQGVCDPCVVRYDYYGNFKTFDADVRILMDHIEAKDEYLRPSYYNSSSNAKDSSNLFLTLSKEQKRGLLHFYNDDLTLYYLIFPSELDTHKTMLGIEDDLKPPAQPLVPPTRHPV